MATCTHLDQVLVPRGGEQEYAHGCEDCLAIGGQWLHLRRCRSCGKVGCCDSSPNQHASKHARATEHPVISSLEPGEDWSYCYVDDVAYILDETA